MLQFWRLVLEQCSYAEKQEIFFEDEIQNRHQLHDFKNVCSMESMDYEITGCERHSSFFLPGPPFSSFFALALSTKRG